MTDMSLPRTTSSGIQWARLRIPLFLLLAVVAVGIALNLLTAFNNLTVDDALLTDSTLGELAVWMADQTEEEEIESVLGQYAENWAQSIGEETLDSEILLVAMRNSLVIWTGLVIVLTIVGVLGVLFKQLWGRYAVLLALLGMGTLLFIIPPIEGDATQSTVLYGMLVLVAMLIIPAEKLSKILGFFIVLALLLVAWEAVKSFAESVQYKVTLPQGSWSYQTYDTLDDSLLALEAGDINGVLFDRNDLEDVMAPYPLDADEDINPDEMQYPNLRYLNDLDSTDSLAFLPMIPEFPGRLRFAVRLDDVDKHTATTGFLGDPIGTVAGDFAEERYLSEPRNLVLLDLKIFNDLNLPHLQNIAEAFLQPARRNGSQLLVRILGDAGLFTWGEAVFGFIFGGLLGFLLGTIFAHSPLMERGLLPYVVASQTVPILAIAPMVVIWLGAGPLSVSVIAAYLTFFPVTINTLRGLQSPKPTVIELMQSYAASRWTILWKVRFPAALPYIFTALKVSATASVVGAIIGELPSGIGDGLGRAILDFSSDYSLISTPKLWASIVMAAFVGILFFVIVSLVERWALRGYIRTT